MQVILTATAVPNMFGPGLNGFKGSIPPLPPPTELSAEFFNSVQMELVYPIINQGYVLDGLQFDQLDFALNNWFYQGAVGVANGASMTFLAGSTLTLDAGSTFACLTDFAIFYGDLQIGDDASDVLFVLSSPTFYANASFVSTAVFYDNVDIGDNITDSLTITSTIDAKVGIAAVDNASPLLNVTNAGTGGGVNILVAGGYAGYFQTDSTSPTKSAIHLEPQDADPSSPLQGDVYHHNVRGKLRQRHFSQWESVHSSPKGSVLEYTATSDQIALVGTTGNVAGTVISPEQTGNVLVTGSFFWDPSGDTDTVLFILRDDTAGVNLTSKTFRAKDIDGAGARGESVVLRKVYALPSTASRTFVLNITTSAAADVLDIVLSVQGVT